ERLVWVRALSDSQVVAMANQTRTALQTVELAGSGTGDVTSDSIQAAAKYLAPYVRVNSDGTVTVAGTQVDASNPVIERALYLEQSKGSDRAASAASTSDATSATSRVTLAAREETLLEQLNRASTPEEIQAARI